MVRFGQNSSRQSLYPRKAKGKAALILPNTLEEFSLHTSIVSCLKSSYVYISCVATALLKILHKLWCFRLSYELQCYGDVLGGGGDFKPNFWQAELQGDDPDQYTDVLETLIDVPEGPSTYRSFTVVIPAGVATVSIIFTSQHVSSFYGLGMQV